MKVTDEKINKWFKFIIIMGCISIMFGGIFFIATLKPTKNERYGVNQEISIVKKEYLNDSLNIIFNVKTYIYEKKIPMNRIIDINVNSEDINKIDSIRESQYKKAIRTIKILEQFPEKDDSAIISPLFF